MCDAEADARFPAEGVETFDIAFGIFAGCINAPAGGRAACRIVVIPGEELREIVSGIVGGAAFVFDTELPGRRQGAASASGR